MKKLFPLLRTISTNSILTVSILWLIGCQEEIEPVEIISDSESILPQSELSQLILKVTMLDGSDDNIIDLSSCTTVVFPISGDYEDSTITFSSLKEVQNFGVEALDIEWIYPFDVVLSDHSRITLDDSDDLDDIQDNCQEGGDDNDIECIDFIYPIELSVYDRETEAISTMVVDSDSISYKSFKLTDQIISIEYPINVVNSREEIYTVASNELLSNAIINSEGECFEEDVIDFEDDVFTDLGRILIEDEWKVDLLEEEGEDLSEDFNAYTFEFTEDLQIIAQSETDAINGEWEIDSFDSIIVLEINFETEDSNFTELNAEWEVIDFDQNFIYLQAYDESEESVWFLRLTK